MAFHDVRLDEDIERGAQGGPRFKTTVKTLSSGFEKRNIDWQRTRGRWDISYGLDTKANLEGVLAFFYARQGRAHSFRFKDWTDFQIGVETTDTPQAIGVGDAVVKKFQIVRRYTSGATTFDREITRPTGTVRVFLDAAEQFADFTVDNSTGVVTFTSAPGGGVLPGVICEFDVPVRFDTDQLDLEAFRDDAFSAPELNVLELRETLASLA